MNKKNEIIGEGVFWIVKRLLFFDDGIEKSMILKESKKCSIDDVEKNIKKFKLIISIGLPTLTWFRKAENDIYSIEAEDLNPPNNCDGYFVSPNTITNGLTFASEVARFIAPYADRNSILKNHENNLELIDYLHDIMKAYRDGDKLRVKYLLKGAECIVYSNKIKEIKNISNFLIQVKRDMNKAANNNIQMFVDAFFFRVKDSTSQIEYKIADFDCVNLCNDIHNCKSNLYEFNLNEMLRSLLEYVNYFVVEDKKNEYNNLIKSHLTL